MIRLMLMVLGVALVGCSSLPDRRPVPIEQTYLAQPMPGVPAVRAFGGMLSQQFEEDLIDSIRQGAMELASGSGAQYSDVNVLSLSGGASYGAFGAGFLNGWTQSGTRPTFKVVTGISTGALIAPFAFLGPDYDAALHEVYTTVGPDDIFEGSVLRAAIWGDALADSAPLSHLIALYFDEPFMAEVARAHSQGRRLYIGTTHLDADALVVWNMGAIASSGHPEALTLFRKIILASSSVPGLFPPVLIDVQVDGLSYDEMHVDGGIKTQLFVTAATTEISRIREQFASLTGERAHVSIFVIRNGVTSPSPEPVPRRVAAISQRAMQSMIRSQVQHDLNEVYDFAQENGFEFNWVAPPREFTIEDVGFNTLEMNQLYDAGFEMGQQAEPGWLKEP